MIKDTKDGTITDIDGKYRIKTEKGKTLIFECVGYKTKEVKVNNAKMDVYLEQDPEGLKKINEIITTAPLILKDEIVFGFVYDEQKQPLIGVTVLIKGTNNGTVTDINGKYRIKTEKGKTLVFSCPADMVL